MDRFDPTWPQHWPDLGSTLAFSLLFPGLCEVMLPTLGLSCAQLRRQMPPLRMLSPACVETCPSCAMLKPGPSWAQVGAKWPEFGASYAQVGPRSAPVRPKLRPRTAKFDPSRLLVGPSRPASFLSIQFPGCGLFSSRSGSKYIQLAQIKPG